ncbi:multidrug resistance-associated protein 5 [Tanacetum coccineum]|uniref:Multidrug resistance-associated protein 5 n=1 Tax=Tanacetum coccineum TaxID=301880 RepID=A0ABQ5E1L1_9ASTR
MGRDANNQMYPIAWVVVRVENADNWGWFLHLLHDDLSLNDGNGITIISDSHKGLIDVVNDWLPEAAAASCYTRQQFVQIHGSDKTLHEGAYDYLIQRNPNSWSRAFFEMDRRCAAFENGISESFNRAILIPRHKPIITMLEEIRLYIMQRLAAMNKVAFSLEDRITPSIRKRLEILKEKQREWTVFPSGFQELEIRKGDHSYGVNLQHKVCQCRMWELSGVPCVHAVAAYLHVGNDLDLGVSHWYSQESWFNAYQFSIKPVFGSNMWKRTSDVPPLPPLVRTMPGRPQKARIKAPGETCSSHTSRVGRTMTCTNCWQKGHNKASCKADPIPKPTVEKKQPGRKKNVVVGHCASRGRGRGRGRSVNEASGSGMGGINEANGSGMETSGGGTRDGGTSSRGGGTSSRGRGRGRRGGGTTSSGGRRGGGRGSRGVGSTRGGGMAGSSSMGILTAEEEYQLELDEEAFRECMQEQAREQAKIDVEQESIHNLPTQQSGVAEESIVDKGKGKESPADEASGTKRKRGRPPSHVDGIRIYHKNRGRSERDMPNMSRRNPVSI